MIKRNWLSATTAGWREAAFKMLEKTESAGRAGQRFQKQMPVDFARILAGAPAYRKKYIKEIEREPATTATFVISFPKSGRTWHRALVGTYLAQLTGHDHSEIFELDKLTGLNDLGRVRYSHNGANFIDGLEPSDPLVASPELWRGKRVVLIVRDVRDVLISAWHHARFRSELTNADLPSFVRRPQTGIEKVLTAYNRWQAELEQASEHLVISYEQMHRDPADALKRTLSLMGLHATDDAAIEAAIRECRFETMRDREVNGFYTAAIATTTSPDERARKARAGRVGAYADYLDAADLAFIAEAEERMGNPFSALSRHGG